MALLTERENEMFGLLSEKKQSGLPFSDRENELFGLLSEKRGFFERVSEGQITDTQQLEGQITDTQRLERGVQSFLPKPSDNSGATEKVYFSDSKQEVDVPAGGATMLHQIMQDDAFDDKSEKRDSTVLEETIANIEKQAVYLALLANSVGLVDDKNIDDFIADRSTALSNAQKHAPEYVSQFQTDYKNAKGFFEHGAVILKNPRALGRLIVTQAPNSIIPLLTGLVGSIGGPAGFLGGTFLGDSIVEIGAWMDQEIQRKGVDMSDRKQVFAVLQDDAFMKSIRDEAVRKGITTAGIDTLFAAFGAKLIKRALPKPTTLQKVGRGAGLAGIETVGEGVGEAGGAAVVGRLDIPDAVLEGIAGLGQSVGQTSIGLSLAKGKKAVGLGDKKADVEEGKVSDTEKLQRAADKIAKEEKTVDVPTEKKESVKAKDVTPETVSKAVEDIKQIISEKEGKITGAGIEVDTDGGERIEKVLKSVAQTKKDREIVIKGRIKAINTELKPILSEIKGLETLKSKTKKPTKGLLNKIERLNEKKAKLDAEKQNLIRVGLANNLKLGKLSEETIGIFQSLLNKEALKEADIDTSKIIEIKGEKIISLGKQSLKAQEQALFKGIREGATATKKNIKQVRKNIRDMVSASGLSAKDKKHILGLTKFENKTNFLKIQSKLKSAISKALVSAKRKLLVDGIKDAVADAKKAKNISIDAVRAIEGLVEDIEFGKPTKKSIERVQKSFLSVKEVPDAIIKKLEKLSKKNIREFSEQDLQTLLDQINKFIDIGKKKLETRKKIKKHQREKNLKAIDQDGKKIEDSEGITSQSKGVAGELTRTEERNNVFKRAFNVSKRKFIALTPMDVVFNMMSKTGDFKGAVFEIFKRPIDKSFREYNKQKLEAQGRVQKAVDDLNINEASRERVLVFAQMRQEDGKKKLLSSGYKEAALDAFFAEGITEDETKLLNVITNEFEKLRPLVLEVLKIVDNKDFSTIKDFFPMMTDFKAMEQNEIKNRFGTKVTLLDGEIDSSSALKKNVKFSSTFKRTGAGVPIKLDAVDVAFQHIDNALYYIHNAELLKDLGELAATREFGESVGNIGQEVTREWIDLIVRKGSAEGNRIWIADWLRRNTAWAVLGYKLSSIVIQPTAIFDGAAVIGSYAFKGAKNIALSKEWRSFIANNFIEIKLRMGDDIALADMMKNGEGAPVANALFGQTAGKALTKARIGAFWELRTLDGMTASAVAAGAYEKIVTEKGGIVDFKNPDQDAILEAELIVRRTQGSGDFRNAPSATSIGKFTGNVSIDKLIFQFQTFMLTRFSLVSQLFSEQGFRLKPTQQSLNVATWLTLAVIAEVGVRRGVQELLSAVSGDDLDDFSEEFPEKFAWQVAASIPFAGQVVNSFHYGNASIPSLNLLNRGLKNFDILVDTKDDKKKQKRALQLILILAGEIGGIPGTLQVEQIISKVWNVKKPKRPKLSHLQ